MADRARVRPSRGGDQLPAGTSLELGGNTIWAPALLHFVVQATVKVVVFSQGAESFALVWMAASATIPLLVFTVKAPVRG